MKKENIPTTEARQFESLCYYELEPQGSNNLRAQLHVAKGSEIPYQPLLIERANLVTEND